MRKNLFIKLTAFASSAAFMLATVAPAQAASKLFVPKIFQEGATLLAQEGFMPPPSGTLTPPPGGTYTAPPTGTYSPPPDSSGTYTPPPTGTFTPPPGDQMMQPGGTFQQPSGQFMPQPGDMMQPGMQPGTGQFGQQQGTQQSCRVNGVEMPGGCNDIQSFSTGPMDRPAGQMNGPNMDQGQFGQPQQFGQQPGDRQGSGPQGQQGLKDMQRGVKQMEGNVKQFERMLQQAEKKGQQMSPEMKEKITRAKESITKVKSAKSAEEISDFNMDEFSQDIQSMEQERREQEQQDRQLKDIKRGMSGATQGLKMFKKQLAQLAKKKIAVPTEIAETVQKIEAAVAAIQKAKTWDEVEAAGLEDLQDMFMGLDEQRQQLEMLTRWPQTVKQAQREITNMTRELKRAKSIVTKLAKKGIDLSDEYGAMESAVNKLKETLGAAQAKVKEGSSESVQEAFELLENEFFGQMDDVWEANRVIQTMSNLGQFTSDFKRGIADAKRQISQLKRQRIDTGELAEVLAEAQAAGNEIVALLKAKPIDEDAVIEAIQGMEDFRQQFDEKARELRGEQEVMPWQKGPEQFKSVSSGINLEQFIPKQEAAPAEEEPVQ